MGLFGGFKAKFSRNTRPKEKPSKHVVALNYRVKTEFDSSQPPNAVPTGGKVHLRSNPPTREPSIVRSQIFEKTNKELQDKLKSTSLSNLPTKTHASGHTSDYEYEEPFTINKIKNKSNNIKERLDSPLSEEPIDEYIKTNSLYKSNSSNTIDDEYEDVTPVDDYKFGDNSDSPLILMTQNSDTSLSSNTKQKLEQARNPPRMTQNSDTSNTKQISFPIRSEQARNPPRSFPSKLKGTVMNNSNIFPTSSDTEEDFKVNVVQHDLINYVSEDELSQDEVEDEDLKSYSRMSFGYSSQATSIFFGDTEPTITRPRRLQLRNDYESNEDEC